MAAPAELKGSRSLQPQGTVNVLPELDIIEDGFFIQVYTGTRFLGEAWEAERNDYRWRILQFDPNDEGCAEVVIAPLSKQSISCVLIDLKNELRARIEEARKPRPIPVLVTEGEEYNPFADEERAAAIIAEEAAKGGPEA